MSLSTRERKTNNMANITYSAAGTPNKKSSAIINLNITLDCGETVSLELVWDANVKCWFPAENTSARAAYLYCVYVTHDRCWNDKALQNYINRYYNLKMPTRRQSTSENLIAAYFQWKATLGKDVEVLFWGDAK